MKLKRLTRITIESCSTTTIRDGGSGLESSVCSVCRSTTAALPLEHAASMFALPAAEIAEALAAGEVHVAGPEGLCAASLIRRFLPGPGKRILSDPLPQKIENFPENK